MSILKSVLSPMSGISKPQRQFVVVLLSTLMCRRGKANFRNRSRYSDYNENTYSRWFRRDFDLVEFNRLSLAPLSHSGNTLVAAIDGSFIS
jgi:hypothetical protein